MSSLLPQNHRGQFSFWLKNRIILFCMSSRNIFLNQCVSLFSCYDPENSNKVFKLLSLSQASFTDITDFQLWNIYFIILMWNWSAKQTGVSSFIRKEIMPKLASLKKTFINDNLPLSLYYCNLKLSMGLCSIL